MNIFELGLGTNNTDVPSNMGSSGNPGASHFAWSDFFINANIYGADIDTRILFNNDRIKTFFCDQTSPKTISELWEKVSDTEFDIIIEDGLHEFDANICFLQNSFHKLKKNGLYFVEDINIANIHKFENFMNNWKESFSDWQVNLLPSQKCTSDNALLIIRK